MANQQALEELNHEINEMDNIEGFNRRLEMLGENAAEGDDPFEVGRRV